MRWIAFLWLWPAGSSAFDGYISAMNSVRRVVDSDNGVVCYVAVEGMVEETMHGISCVKVK